MPVRSHRLAAVGAGALVAAAVCAAVLAIAWSGAASPQALLDPGALARWGAPVVTVLTQLATSVTVGALALAAAVLPRGTGRVASDGRAWRHALTVASVAAGAWTVLQLVHLVLTYATVSGTAPSSPSFGPELGLFVGSVTLGRILLTTTLLAAVTCVVAQVVATPRGALLTALLPLAALAVQSQTGHAAGSTNHELAVSSMFLHMAGAALWVGTLVALALVAGRLGTDLRPAVERFSTVAAWCVAAVAVSGLASASMRVSPDDLGTTYGLLLVAKVALFVLAAALGWLHRRVTIPRLDVSPRLFWRVAAVELAVLGAVSGVAVGLSEAEPPTPQEPTGALTPAEIVTGHPLPPPPEPMLWLTSFRWDMLPAAGAAAGLVVYLTWVARLRRRGDRWPWSRVVCVVAGLGLFAWTTSGGPAVYGHVLFSAHMLQHMLLVMVVPIFLALSAPVTLAARALPVRRDGSRGPREWLLGTVHSRWATVVAHPVVAAVNFAGSMIVFYWTDLFAYALTTYVGHLLMIVHFTLTGYLFANALVGVDPGPSRPGYPARLLVLFSTMAFHAFFGVAIVSQETLLAPEWFGVLGRPWGPSALADQRDGGAIAWGISELPMLALAIGIAVAWTKDDERTARRQDRAAERDGDAELTEYNAMLSRMAGRGGRP